MRSLRSLLFLTLLLCTTLSVSAQFPTDPVEFQLESGYITAAQVTRDGSKVLTVCSDSTIRLWNGMTGKEVWSMRRGSQAFRYAYLMQNERMMTVTNDGELTRWSLSSGTPRELSTFFIPKSPVTGFSDIKVHFLFWRDGILVYKKDSIIFEPSEGARQSFHFEEHHPKVSPDNKILGITTSPNESLGLITRSIGVPVIDTNHPAGGYFYDAIEISRFRLPVGPIVDGYPNDRDTLMGFFETALLCPDTTKAILDSRTMFQLDPWEIEREITNLESWSFFSPSGKYLVTYSYQKAKLIDTGTWEVIDSIEGDISTVASFYDDAVDDLGANPEKLFVAFRDGRAIMTRPEKPPGTPAHLFLNSLRFDGQFVGQTRDTVIPRLLRNISTEPIDVRLFASSPDGSIFTVVEPSGTVRLQPEEELGVKIRFSPEQRLVHRSFLVINYETPSGTQQGTIALSGEGYIPYFQPGDERYTLMSNAGTNVLVKSVTDQDAICTYYGINSIREVDGTTGSYGYSIPYRYVSTDPSSGLILCREDWSSNDSLHLFNPVDGSRVKDYRLKYPVGTAMNYALFSPVPSLLGVERAMLTIDSNRYVRIWDLENRQILKTLMRPAGESGVIYNGLFTSDGQYLLGTGTDSAMYVWNVVSGDLVRVIKRDVKNVYPLAILSPDNRLIAARNGRRVIGIWDFATGTLLRELSGHQDDSEPIGFTPDGTTLLSIGRDSTARLWDVATGTERAVLKGHRADVLAGAISPDGLRAVTVGANDNRVMIWDIPSGTLLKEVFAAALRTGPRYTYYSVSHQDAIRFNQEGGVLGYGNSSNITLFGPSTAIPYIIPNVDSLDLTPTSIAKDTVISVSLRNNGPIALELRPKVYPSTSIFTLVDTMPFNIPPGGTHTVYIDYRPATMQVEKGATPLSSTLVAANLGFMYGRSGSIANIRLQGNGPTTTGVATHRGAERQVGILTMIPNPANAHLSVQLQMPTAGTMRLSLISMVGKSIGTLSEERFESGNHIVEIDTAPFPSGEYILLLEAPGVQDVRLLRIAH